MASTGIYRGDSDTFTLSIPLTIWSPGGKFFFALKNKGDIATVDLTDSNAILKKTYDDSFITATTSTDTVYTLKLLPADTQGKTPGKFIAEFQWVSADGTMVKTFAQFKYEIKADINQRVS